MLRFLSIIVLSIWCIAAKAGTIIFTIKNKATHETIVGCKVKYKDVTCVADSNGQVSFTNVLLPADFVFSSIGFEETKKSVFQIKNTNQVVYLNPSVTDLKQMVVTGQSTPVLAMQSVYRVNTINSQQIYQRGAVTLNDVLNFENNNFISNDNILGSSVSMGGISGQNVKILVNGIALTGRENGNIDLGQINLQNVKRVEMIQGPMSVVYGSNAMGGVINLITYTPTKPFSIQARSYFETIGKYNLSTNIGFQKQKHTAQLSLARLFFQGWSPNDSGDRFNLWKPKTQYTADLNYHYKLNPKLDLHYFGSFLKEKISNKGLPIISPYEGYAFDEYYRTTRLINSINATYKFGKHSNLSLMNGFTHYQRNKNRYKKDLVTLVQIPTTNSGDQDSSQFNTLQLRGVYSNDAFKNSSFSLGYEWMNEVATSSKLSGDTKPASDLGLFGSLLYRYKKWSLQPSARYTLNNLFNNAFTPALHVKYDVNNQWQIRASYANGFRTPSLKEMYLQFVDQNHTILGNTDLSPEFGHRIELGTTYNSNANKRNRIQLNGNVAFNDIRNMITLAVYQSHSVLRQYVNISRYHNAIGNLSATMYFKNLTLREGIGYTIVQEGLTMPQHSILEFTQGFSYQITALKMGVNLNYKYSSQQPVISTDNTFLLTDPLHIANVSVQRSFFNKALNIQIGMKNVFNLQSTTLNGASDLQGNAHVSANGMNLFPERSIYIDLNYNY